MKSGLEAIICQDAKNCIFEKDLASIEEYGTQRIV